MADFPVSDGAFVTILACLRRSKTPSAGSGAARFPRGSERKKSDQRHSAAEIHSHSPVSRTFTIMWRHVVGG
jgi:hypothetical protein